MSRSRFLGALVALRILYLHCRKFRRATLAEFDDAFDNLTAFLEDANNEKPTE